MGRAIKLIHERTRNSIWSVLVLALIIRLAFPVLVAGLAESPKVFHAADSGLYLNPAISLIKTGKFVASPDNPTPEITRTPGYPVFLLPAVILGKVELVAIAMQILVSCLTVYLVYRIGLLLFAKNSTAILCALLYAIEPLSVIFTSLIMTETLFTCLLVACVFFLLRYLHRGALTDLVISGFGLALSAFVRSVSLFLPLWAAMVLLVVGWIKRADKAKTISYVTVFLIVSIMPILLWQARNKIETGYSGFSEINDLGLYWYVRAGIQARLEGKTTQQQQTDMGFRSGDKYFELHPEQRSWSRVQMLQYWRREAIKTILSEPTCFLVLYLESQIKFLLAPGAGELLGSFGEMGSFQSPEFAANPDALIAGRGIVGRQLVYAKHWPVFFWTGVILGSWLFVYLLLSAIAMCSRQFFTLPVMIVLAIALYFMLIHFDTGSPYRFRLPVMPIICLFAGYGLSLVLGGVKKDSNLQQID
jgi:4-amino-4-deoxy-L-arabinose transferase-like glycosyltransferase